MRCSSGQATTSTAAAVYFLTGRGVACRTEAAGSDSTVAVEGRAVEGHRCGRTGELGSAANNSSRWASVQAYRNEKARAARASSAFLYVDLNVQLGIIFPPFGFRQALHLKEKKQKKRASLSQTPSGRDKIQIRGRQIARGSRRTRSEKRSGWDFASVGHLVCLVQACVKGLYLCICKSGGVTSAGASYEIGEFRGQGQGWGCVFFPF